jgi:hypothetical protein
MRFLSRKVPLVRNLTLIGLGRVPVPGGPVARHGPLGFGIRGPPVLRVAEMP